MQIKIHENLSTDMSLKTPITQRDTATKRTCSNRSVKCSSMENFINVVLLKKLVIKQVFSEDTKMKLIIGNVHFKNFKSLF